MECRLTSVHYDDHPNDIAMRNRLPIRRRRQCTTRSARFSRTFPTPPYPNTHNMGTNRMSEETRVNTIVNKYGQTHDIKNLFVSDGS